MAGIDNRISNLDSFRTCCKKVIPLVFDNSWSVYENLCRISAKLNEVIESQNLVIDQVNALTILFQELKDFVNNYFDNLDVQEEINKKLEEMFQDGSLAEIINEQIFNNLSNRIDEIEKLIKSIVSGGPVEVFQTLDQLKYKYPNGANGLMLVTDDGFLYWWNGTDWTRVIQYQSVELADGSVDINKLSDSLKTLILKGIMRQFIPTIEPPPESESDFDTYSTDAIFVLNEEYEANTTIRYAMVSGINQCLTLDLIFYRYDPDRETYRYLDSISYPEFGNNQAVNVPLVVVNKTFSIPFYVGIRCKGLATKVNNNDYPLYNFYYLQAGESITQDLTRFDGQLQLINNLYLFGTGASGNILSDKSITLNLLSDQLKDLILNQGSFRLIRGFNEEEHGDLNWVADYIFMSPTLINKGSTYVYLQNNSYLNGQNVRFYLLFYVLENGVYKFTDYEYVNRLGYKTPYVINKSFEQDTYVAFRWENGINMNAETGVSSAQLWNFLRNVDDRFQDINQSNLEQTRFNISFDLYVKNENESSSITYTNYITVGKDASTDFSTVNEAINSIVDDSETNRYKIIIYEGTYPRFDTNTATKRYIDIEGVSRDRCIIKDDTGNYNTPPINIRTDGYLKNLTVIATHDNPVWGDDRIKSYAIHSDFGDYNTTIENCTLISYQAPALGCGLFTDSQLIVRDCDLYSYATADYGGLVDYGAIWVHSNTIPTTTNQKFILHNCRIYSRNGTYSWRCYDLVNNDNFEVEFSYNRCLTAGISGVDGINADFQDITPNRLSFGNNLGIMNYINEPK